LNEQMQERWVGLFAWVFLVALLVWVVAAATLGIPHGPGHSIESMTPVQTVYDISLPTWLGSIVGIIGLLAVKAFGAIRRSEAPRSN
jgi:hypothetical protein